MKCFVCDAVVNNAVDIDNVILQESKTSLVKKLGQLFPERFYVVCEKDVICRTCVSLLNKLDTLDEERAKVKRNVLGLIERKYRLKDGDLSYPTEESYEPPPTFAARKRAAEEDAEKMASAVSDDPRSRIWMQCKSCKYTTNYTQFVKRHVQKQACFHCGGPLKKSLCLRRCTESVHPRATLPEDSPPVLSLISDTPILMPATLANENGDAEESILIAEGGELEGQISIPEPTEEEDEDTGDMELCYNVLDGDESEDVREVLIASAPGEQCVQIVSWNEETNSLVPFILKNI